MHLTKHKTTTTTKPNNNSMILPKNWQSDRELGQVDRRKIVNYHILDFKIILEIDVTCVY